MCRLFIMWELTLRYDWNSKQESSEPRRYLVLTSQTEDENPGASRSQCNPTSQPAHHFDVTASKETSMKRALCAEQSLTEITGTISAGYSPRSRTMSHTHMTHTQAATKTLTPQPFSQTHERIQSCRVLCAHTRRRAFFPPCCSFVTEYALCWRSVRERWGVGAAEALLGRP